MLIKVKAYEIKSKKVFELDLFVIESDVEDLITISTNLKEVKIIAADEFYFNTLQKIRKKLISKGVDLKCYGAMENVYPSPMMLNSTKAYILKNGEQARSKDIVDIFDYSDISVSICVEKQELFYSNWIKGIISSD